MSLYDNMPDANDNANADHSNKKRKLDIDTDTTSTTATSNTTATATTTTIVDDSTKQKSIDIPDTIKRLTTFMTKDDKFIKASVLFVNVINASLDNDNVKYIVNAIASLIRLDRNYNDDMWFSSYINIFKALKDKIDIINNYITSSTTTTISSSSSSSILSKDDMINWINKTVLIKDLDTDDSFLFTQCCKDITEYIKSLDTNEEDDLDNNIYKQNYLEKQTIIIKLLSTAYKSYHLAWKAPNIKSIFKEASSRRLKFDLDLRNQLDDLATDMVKDERKIGSNTKNRTIRTTNSIAHPLRNVGGEQHILR